MTTPYQSDHEQRAVMIDGVMKYAFASMTPQHHSYAIAKGHAEAVTDAVLEAQDAYNVAKAGDVETVTVSRKTLNVLLTVTGRFYGMSDLASGENL